MTTDRSVPEILADWPPRRPLTATEAASLVAQPERIVDVVAAVKRALADMQQEIIEREQSEGVKS